MSSSNKKIILMIILIASVSALIYLSYPYIKSKLIKKEVKIPKEVAKPKSHEEIAKEFTTPPPDANKIEFTKEQEGFTRLISKPSVPAKIDPYRVKLIKQFTAPQ